MIFKKSMSIFISFLLVFGIYFSSFQTIVFSESESASGAVTVMGDGAPDERPYEYVDGKSAVEVLIETFGEENVEYSETDYGISLDRILDLTIEEPYYWAFYVNGISAQVGSGSYIVQEGDHLTFIYTDWTVTAEQETTLTVVGDEGTMMDTEYPIAFIGEPTAFDLLLVVMGYDNVDYEFHDQWGIMIEGIGGLAEEDTYYWAFYVNEEAASVGAGNYTLQTGDSITFVYESWEQNEEETTVDEEQDEQLDRGNYDKEEIKVAVDSASNYILNRPIGEWQAVALHQAGYTVPSSYLENVKQTINEVEGTFSNITDTTRYSLGILAAGADPTNIEGYNLIEAIYNGENITTQGLIGVAFSLIALDSAAFEVPENAIWNREKLVAYLLDRQNDDGGWDWSDESSSDMDSTAMILTSLAPYNTDATVKGAIDNAVLYLSVKYSEGEVNNSSTAAQIIIAFSALGLDVNNYLYNDVSLIEYLLTFQDETDGGFGWQSSDSDDFSTEQAFRGVVAYQLLLEGKSSLHSFDFESKNDEQLPVRVTTNYYLLVIGVVILFVLFITIYYRQRRMKAKQQ